MSKKALCVTGLIVLLVSAGTVQAGTITININQEFSSPDGGFIGGGGFNDNGQAVFSSSGGADGQTGFRRNANGTFTQISYPGSSRTDASGINDLGQIVGLYCVVSCNAGYEYSGGTYTSLPGTLFASAINGSGTSVGEGNGDGFIRDAAGDFTFFTFPGSVTTFANGVNDSGQVVGEYCDSPCFTNNGFFRDVDGSITNFGLSGEDFLAINNAGDILMAGAGGYSVRHANGTIDNLIVQVGTNLTDLNNNGQFFGTLAHGAFIGSAATTPEPATCFFTFIGLAVLAIRAKYLHP